MDKWEFWIDRGGTFTDIIAKTPDEQLQFQKLLSVNPSQYTDAALQGIRNFLQLSPQQAIPSEKITAVNMGTTVATNALLERQGEPTLLLTTLGFKDALAIGYQNRPDLFSLEIQLPSMLYQQVAEVNERISAEGEILTPLDISQAEQQLQSAYEQGLRSVAIVLMHGYRYPIHEKKLAELANNIGYLQISVSHQVNPLPKFVSRGDTTVVDAYLTPILKRYIASVEKELKDTKLHFMQSNGGLTAASNFNGKDSILSGPAGGVVGMVNTAKAAGYNQLVGFDMGGTSTDVCHYSDEYERNDYTEIAGVRITAPMMNIHTVAAGGGSILQFRHGRYQVGPDSAGAFPGPSCYRNDGPLTVTDCHVLLGRIPVMLFPKVFGPNGNKPLDRDIVIEKFQQLAQHVAADTHQNSNIQDIAEGFLKIAIINMANAIKKISVERGFDLTDYTLCSYGSASGQHACQVADELGMTRILIHPFAGGLSALGMGLADHRIIKKQAIELAMEEVKLNDLKIQYQYLAQTAMQALLNQGFGEDCIKQHYRVNCRYQDSDTSLEIAFADKTQMQAAFTKKHQQHFGFTDPQKIITIESIGIEIIGLSPNQALLQQRVSNTLKSPINQQYQEVYLNGATYHTPIYHSHQLTLQQNIQGPAIIVEATNTIVIEPGWCASLHEDGHLLLSKQHKTSKSTQLSTERNPVMLEIFNNQFMAIAEQMGVVLRNTAYSVNIKERLDFSCAVFDQQGDLVANAPHIPVHLGSMSESVKYIHQQHKQGIQPGDVYMLNSPYCGGTHLPDITVISPVFDESQQEILFYVASRGHHADIGGITPGSMPPTSRHIEEEGALIEDVQIVKQGQFLEAAIHKLFTHIKYPGRNVKRNISDIKAQIAANERGKQELIKLTQRYGLGMVHAYMQHIKDNARECVESVLKQIDSGHYRYPMDNQGIIDIKIEVNQSQGRAIIDFNGTQSPPGISNFNAPLAVVKAAILYVLRCLVKANIPLNAGCLEPISFCWPTHGLLNPHYPDPVVAGNVETSQCIVNAAFAALGVMAAAQGTSNNFTFGNQNYQYYETICGGAGAGPHWTGADAVHTHMTNTRLTDPEILEWRFPVILEEFSIRKSSGGQGQYVGGNGTRRKIKFLQTMTASILSGHRIIAPVGIAGGAAGQCGRNYIIRKTGKIDKLSACASVSLQPGDYFVIETPGGGGYGTKSG